MNASSTLFAFRLLTDPLSPTTMFNKSLGILCLQFSLFLGVRAQAGCPRADLACHDVMNGSQCLAQVIIDGRASMTREKVEQCVHHEGTASDLSGGAKVWVSRFTKFFTAGGPKGSTDIVSPALSLPCVPHEAHQRRHQGAIPRAMQQLLDGPRPSGIGWMKNDIWASPPALLPMASTR